ncbi:hypothetical protein IAR50_004552 [Cryptococcus sp. DSM 104548]
MHALLGSPEKQLVCAEFIKALEDCHARGLLAKVTGQCNKPKLVLNECLREERIERTTRNRDEAKERNARKKAVWAALEKEKAEERGV